jgi:hypothetical protein
MWSHIGNVLRGERLGDIRLIPWLDSLRADTVSLAAAQERNTAWAAAILSLASCKSRGFFAPRGEDLLCS